MRRSTFAPAAVKISADRSAARTGIQLSLVPHPMNTGRPVESTAGSCDFSTGPMTEPLNATTPPIARRPRLAYSRLSIAPWLNPPSTIFLPSIPASRAVSMVSSITIRALSSHGVSCSSGAKPLTGYHVLFVACGARNAIFSVEPFVRVSPRRMISAAEAPRP